MKKMLLDDFFTISGLQMDAGSIRAILTLNPGHKIFEGHFPGQPVVPGACMLQMVKELAAKIGDEELQLIRADHLKFIAVIIPDETSPLQMVLTYSISENGEMSVSADLSENSIICFKFKGLFMTRRK